jgi:hypothetical protein
MGISLPFPRGAWTDTSQTPPSPGSSNRTTSRGRLDDVTVLDH